jgi:DNA-binding MarR family transcriptional regulator
MAKGMVRSDGEQGRPTSKIQESKRMRLDTPTQANAGRGQTLLHRILLSSSRPAAVPIAKETFVSNAQRLDDSIVTALRRIIRAIDLHSRDLLQNYGLTAPQLMTLQELARLQPVPVGVLSGAVHVSQATMTGILDRLEQRGMVLRTRDGVDRRSVTITLTAEGAKLQKKAPSLLQDQFREKLARLKPSEQANMLSVLQQIGAMMGAAELNAAPILVTGPESLAGPDGKSRSRKRATVPAEESPAKAAPRKKAAAKKG